MPETPVWAGLAPFEPWGVRVLGPSSSPWGFAGDLQHPWLVEASPDP